MLANRTASRVYFTQPVPDHLCLTEETKQRAMQVPILAVDIESEGEGSRPQDLAYAAITAWGLSALCEITAIGIAFSELQDDGIVLLAPFDQDTRQFLHELFARKDALFLFHNGQYDLRSLCLNLGLPIPVNTYDTHSAAITMGVVDLSDSSLLAQCEAYERVIDGDVTYTVQDPASPDYGKVITDRWTDWHTYRRIKDMRSDLASLQDTLLAWYVLEDARLTYMLYRAQGEWVEILEKDFGYSALPDLIGIDQRYTWVTYDWTKHGMPVDKAFIRRQLDLIEARRFDMTCELLQVGIGKLSEYANKVRYLFDYCGIPRPDPNDPSQEILFTDTGRYAFSKAAMEYYAEVYPSETAFYTYNMHLEKTAATLSGYLAHSMLDDRIHPMIGMGTITGRSSSTNPNTLNVAVKLPEEVAGMEGATTLSARGCLIAPPGFHLGEYDLNAAEKRAQAIAAQERLLAEMFRDGADMHSVFGRVYFGAEWAETERRMHDDTLSEEERLEAKHHLKAMRSKGKPLTFGRDYGMGPDKASRRLKISVDAARELIARFDAEFWRLAQWKRNVQDEAENNYQRMRACPNPLFAHGYVTNPFGRRILISDPAFDESTQKMRNAWYKGSNYIPQSFVADVVKIAVWEIYWKLRNAGLKSRMQQQYHDALIVEIAIDEVEQVSQIVTSSLASAVPYGLSQVDGIYVAWPSDINHAENAEKWGYLDGGGYPWPTHNEDGSPVVMGADTEQIRQGLYEVFLAEEEARIADDEARLHAVLYAGPTGDRNAYVLWVHDNGDVEWLTWSAVPRKFDELNRVAQILYSWVMRSASIPENHVPGVMKYINFVNSVIKMRAELQNRKQRYAAARSQ